MRVAVKEKVLSGAGYIMQKELFRLSALLYAETTNIFSKSDVQTYIVKCIIAQNENHYMSNEELLSQMIQLYNYNISEEELDLILIGTKRIFETTVIDGDQYYRLVNDEYKKVTAILEHSIDYYIKEFALKYASKNSEKCSDSIYRYLYELTTSNINSYEVLLDQVDGTKFSDSELSVNIDYLTDEEQNYVHDFLKWDSSEKNAVLSNIVFCCLEYCLLVSGDKPSPLLAGIIRQREVFLDTNIIFRVLGINGVSRKNVIIAFLKKCQQANLSLVVSKNTKDEFFNTINYYVGKIEHFPRGRIYMGAYDDICDRNIYSYYESWLNSHKNFQKNLKIF